MCVELILMSISNIYTDIDFLMFERDYVLYTIYVFILVKGLHRYLGDLPGPVEYIWLLYRI